MNIDFKGNRSVDLRAVLSADDIELITSSLSAFIQREYKHMAIVASNGVAYTFERSGDNVYLVDEFEIGITDNA